MHICKWCALSGTSHVLRLQHAPHHTSYSFVTLGVLCVFCLGCTNKQAVSL